MQLEQTIFSKYQPNFQQLKKYGFIKKNDGFYFQQNFPFILFKLANL